MHACCFRSHVLLVGRYYLNVFKYELEYYIKYTCAEGCWVGCSLNDRIVHFCSFFAVDTPSYRLDLYDIDINVQVVSNVMVQVPFVYVAWFSRYSITDYLRGLFLCVWVSDYWWRPSTDRLLYSMYTTRIIWVTHWIKHNMKIVTLCAI